MRITLKILPTAVLTDDVQVIGLLVSVAHYDPEGYYHPGLTSLVIGAAGLLALLTIE